MEEILLGESRIIVWGEGAVGTNGYLLDCPDNILIQFGQCLGPGVEQANVVEESTRPLHKGQGFATQNRFGHVLVIIIRVFRGCRGLILASVALHW